MEISRLKLSGHGYMYLRTNVLLLANRSSGKFCRHNLRGAKPSAAGIILRRKYLKYQEDRRKRHILDLDSHLGNKVNDYSISLHHRINLR